MFPLSSQKQHSTLLQLEIYARELKLAHTGLLLKTEAKQSRSVGKMLFLRSVEAGLEGGGGELLPVVGPGVRLGRGGGALVNAETPPLGHGRGRGGLRGGEGVWLTNEGSRGSKKQLD